jgi:hypothetical protein
MNPDYNTLLRFYRAATGGAYNNIPPVQPQPQTQTSQQTYYDMSMQELNHAENLRVIAQEAMDRISYIPEKDQEKWKNKQKKHAEHKAMVKLLLTSK